MPQQPWFKDPEHPQTLFVAKSPWEAVRWARKFMSADEWSQISSLTFQSLREGGKKIEVGNPTQPSDDEIDIASKRPFQTRNLGRGHETPDSNVPDTLQSGPRRSDEEYYQSKMNQMISFRLIFSLPSLLPSTAFRS
jgi:hypothetical protein